MGEMVGFGWRCGECMLLAKMLMLVCDFARNVWYNGLKVIKGN